MITKFNDYLNEGITDMMTSKTKEEILDVIVKNAKVKYGIEDDQLDNFEKCIKYLLDNDYVFDHKDDFNVLWFNWKGNNRIYIYINGFTKFKELKSNVESNKKRFNLE